MTARRLRLRFAALAEEAAEEAAQPRPSRARRLSQRLRHRVFPATKRPTRRTEGEGLRH